MRILFATPEVSDFIQVGGLAAVSAALPRALCDLADVRVIIPGYPAVLRGLSNLQTVGRCQPFAALPAFDIDLGHTVDGLSYYVVRCPALYERDGTPYADGSGADWCDNNVRFATFSYAAAQLARGLVDKDWSADLVHANDWQCALIPGYLEWHYAHIPTVFTIHNLAYQGVFDRSSLALLGIPEASFNIDGVEFYNRLSFIKAGLVSASHLTTVSQTYAREITTAEFGCGLEGLLRQRADRNQLSGTLNGIDESWDPRTCSSLLQPFGAGDWTERSLNADDVRDQFGLAVSRGPLFALVARLVHRRRRPRDRKRASHRRCRRPDRRHRQGRAAVRRGPAPGAGSRAAVHCRQDRLRRRRGAEDIRRQRLHVDAFALRSVWAEPDVPSASVRCRSATAPAASPRPSSTAKPASCSTMYRRRGSLGASAGPSRLSA